MPSQPRHVSPTHPLVHLAALALLTAMLPATAEAGCDVIPQVAQSIRAPGGTIDRPYAWPGQALQITIDRSGCDAAAPTNPGTYQTTVFYEAPTGAVNAVTTTLLGIPPAACPALPGSGQHLFDVGVGAAAGDDLFFTLSSLGGFSGPARIVVQPVSDPGNPPAVPCALATQRCADYGGGSPLLACVDELYADDGTCSEADASRNSLFSAFTALPPENFFRDLCPTTTEAPSCTGSFPDLQVALDAEGNLLLPLNYTDIEAGGALPVPRFLSGTTSIDAFPGSGTPPQIPGGAFYDSFSSNGRLLPPFFSDVEDPLDPLAAAFLGTVDTERAVLRFLRRSPFFLECRDDVTDAVVGAPCAVDGDCPTDSSCGSSVCYAAGVATATPCASDAQCGSGEECGPALFEFSTRLSLAGAGPLLVSSSEYVAEAQNEVPLDCLFQTDDVIVACRSERAEGVDLNGDGDTEDQTVVALRDRESGALIPIGGGGAQGIAATRAKNGTFSDPSIEVEGDVVAFVQPEGGKSPGAADENGDSDTEDALLRVIELSPGSFTDLVAPGTVEVAADPVVDGGSLAFEGGLVFFRSSEFDGTPQSNYITPSQADPVASPVRTTPDGRFVVFSHRSDDTFAYEELQVVDRDPDENGILDDTAAVVDSTPFPAWNGSISDNGRHVAFQTTEVVPGSGGQVGNDFGVDTDVFVWDRQLDTYLRLSLQRFTIFTVEFDGESTSPQISASGRFVGFVTDAANVGTDLNGSGVDLFIADRDPDEDGIYDELSLLDGLINASRVNQTGGTGGNGEVVIRQGQPFDISRDERWIAFATDASDYAGASDTNQEPDIYMRELDPATGTLLSTPFRLSLRSATDDGSGGLLSPSWMPTLSGDGRFVAFETRDFSAFDGLDGDGSIVAVRDRDPDGNGVFDEPDGDGTPRFALDGFSTLSSVIVDGISLSPEGRFLSYTWDTRDDVNQFQTWELIDLARGEVVAQRGEPLAAFNPDGERPLAEDRLFRSIEDAQPPVGPIPWLYYGRVTGLDTTNVANDLNADGRADDDLFAVLDTRVDPAVLARREPASEIRVDGGNAIFLVPEADVGPNGTDFDADGSADDQVVFVWEKAAAGLPAPASTNQQIAATQIAISGDTLAALVPQPAGLPHLFVAQLPGAGPGSWSDTGIDADQLGATPTGIAIRRGDGALEVIDPSTTTSLAVAPGPIAEFVAAGSLVAFRQEETVASLNGDPDTDDYVLRVLDVPTATVFDSAQAAVPCAFEACDPGQPYRVTGQVVRFLTREADQQADLDGDGSATGLVYQTYNVAATRLDAYPTVTRGLCTDDGSGCNFDADCAAGICFTPPGGCVRDLGTSCNPGALPPTNVGCASGEFCQPIAGTSSGTCFEVFGACDSDAECTLVDPIAFCVDDAQEQRPPDPLLMQPGGGGLAYLSRGACIDGSGSKTGTCRTGADCDSVSTCEPELIFGASADFEHDAVADVVDNCLTVENPDQADLDGDGVGDACDRATCGNGVQEYDEECDAATDCDASCLYTGGGAACSDGVDNDGDGLVDSGSDPGCSDPLDSSERDSGLVCDDGVDNDGDFASDFPADPGCADPNSPSEAPECDDGIDNDGDGFVDFPADPECTSADVVFELPEPAMLLQLVAGLALLWLLARRRTSAAASP